MDRRLQLHDLFLAFPGIKGVYFQPPEGLKMDYPCIIYERDGLDIRHAGDKPYGTRRRYLVTIIDKSPDTPYVEKMAELPLCTYSRHFTTSGLNHDVYNLYY